jgi:uncharacterized repeat protein (TIGR02543 family)
MAQNSGNFSSGGSAAYRLDVFVTVTPVSGGTQLDVSSSATQFNTSGVSPAWSSSGTRGYNVPGGRTSSTSGTLTQAGGANWTYDFGANSTQSVWSGFTRFIADGYGSSTSVTIDATGSGSTFLQSASVTVPISLATSYTYSLSYSSNGGSGSTSSTSATSTSTSYSLAAAYSGFSRSGYNFTGWNTSSNGGGSSLAEGSSVTLSSGSPTLTLYAQWTPTVPAPVFSDGLYIPTLYVGGSAYDYVQASNSTSYSVTSLPSGLNFSNSGTYAQISGVVSAQASQYWNVTVTATNDTGSATTSSAFNVYQALPNWTDFSITSTGTVNTYYSSSISATNATNWTISSLPPGITSSGTSGSTVTFSGTPSSAGSYTIYAQPSNSEGASASQQSFSLTISPRLPSWVDQNLATAARVGLSYSSTVSASYVNSWDDGTLPTNGLSFSGQTNVSGTATGTVSGTPTTYGTTSFTLTPYNSDNQTPGGVAFSITVYDVAPVWSSQVLASSIATQDVAYTDGVSVTAGPDVTYTVASGALPTGVTLNSSSGAITGSPSVVGVYNFVLAATNGSSEVIYTDALTITVEAAGGYAKVWNGSAWVDGATYVRTAGGWAEAVINVKGVSSWGPSFSS